MYCLSQRQFCISRTVNNFFYFSRLTGALGTVRLAVNSFGKSFGQILCLQVSVFPKSRYNLLELLLMFESKHIFELNLTFWVIFSMRRLLYSFKIIKEPYLKLHVACLSRNFSSSFPYIHLVFQFIQFPNKFTRSSMERSIIDEFANIILIFCKKSCIKSTEQLRQANVKTWWKLCFLISESQSTVE